MREPSRHTFVAALLVTNLALAGCTAGTTTTGSAATQATAPVTSVATASSPARPTKPPPRHSRPRHHSHPPAPASSRSGSVAYSTASNNIVQPQPAPGSCHAIGAGLYSRPDPACTPGGLNPAVTQGTIDRTICVDGWTTTVRPAESITEQEKAASMAAYGDSGSIGDYEYDHFVPLELGGATNDPRNLWPEPGASPNPKDSVENELRQAVCDGAMTLAHAQRAIVTNWTSAVGHAPPAPPQTPTAAATAPPTGNGGCTVTASYSSHYNDYDVYVHSNLPDQTVTVTDPYGHSASWHTDGSGYADVYFKASGYAPGRQITAQVGTARCSTTL